jgi:hypothetical protein
MRITKLVAAVIGVPMILGSFAVAVAGGIAIAVPDDDGWVSTGSVRMQTDAAALVGDDIEIDLGGHFANGRTMVHWGELPAELEITSRNDKSVFIGIAEQEDARRYLDGVALDRISSLHDDHHVEHVYGTYAATPPGEVDIWVASGVDGILEWDVQEGDWAIVALNADGSPGVDVAVRASARIPFLTTIGVVLVALGTIGMTAGGFLTYFGVRRVRGGAPVNPPTPPAADPLAAG